MAHEIEFQKNEDIVIVRNEDYLQKAEKLKPALHETIVSPKRLAAVASNSSKIHGWELQTQADAATMSSKVLRKGDHIIVDFGQHLVGYVSLYVQPVGSPPDAPLHLKLTFGEMPVEMAEDFATYEGMLSSSWLQQEEMYIDVLPHKLELPRRYSFRYLKLEVLDTSAKYGVSLSDVTCKHVTSANTIQVQPYTSSNELFRQLDEISIKTLEDCMQDVFEDGPKRDRRLWLGDLRLQALANYVTFKNNDLVKRCLYLFAGVPDDQGRISSNLFMKPNVIADDTYLMDYSLFFADTLVDYYHETQDLNTLQELWPLAKKQVELAWARLDDNGIFIDEGSFWSFIDWTPGLNKQAATQAILIYVMKSMTPIITLLEPEQEQAWVTQIAKLEQDAIQQLWDGELGLFVSGQERQLSWASQVWMIIAGVVSKEQGRLMLAKVETVDAVEMMTPYMYHHLVEAFLLLDEKEKAIAVLEGYWGKMVKDGADTFWELYNPQNKSFSPYGSYLINSYCHAWSCTPTYFIRKYNL